jgi:glutathione S-transferase
MIIFGDMISPFVRMAVVTGHEAGLGARIKTIAEPVKPTEVNARLASLSPIGKVPILETDEGEGLYDSRVIMEYLCHVAGNRSLFPAEAPGRFRVLKLLALGQGLADSAVAYRYETASRPKGLQWEEWMARTITRLQATFDEIETHWIHELDPVNAGSVSVGVALAYMDFRLPNIAWRDGRPKLDRWHATFSDRDSMKQTSLAGR